MILHCLEKHSSNLYHKLCEFGFLRFTEKLLYSALKHGLYTQSEHKFIGQIFLRTGGTMMDVLVAFHYSSFAYVCATIFLFIRLYKMLP